MIKLATVLAHIEEWRDGRAARRVQAGVDAGRIEIRVPASAINPKDPEWMNAITEAIQEVGRRGVVLETKKKAIYRPGDVVRYIPFHANGDVNHRDVEHGTVSSVNASGTVFVKFDRQVDVMGWDGATAQGCNNDERLTKLHF